MLHGAPMGSIQKLQRAQNTAARIVVQAPSRSSAKPLLVTTPTALVASSAADQVQVGSHDVQGAQHVNSGLPTPSTQGTCLQPISTFVCLPAAGSTIHEDRVRQTRFSIFSTVCLEFAITNSSHQRLSAYLQKTLKTFLFSQTFH